MVASSGNSDTSFNQELFYARLRERQYAKAARMAGRLKGGGLTRHQSFDLLQSIDGMLDGAQRLVFQALVFKTLALQYDFSTYREADFSRTFGPSYRSGYDALAAHPFAVSLRDNLCYAPASSLLEALRVLWEADDKGGFLYLYEAARLVDGSGRTRPSSPLGETLNEQISAYPGLELVILQAPMGQARPVDAVSSPSLSIVVSNSPAQESLDQISGGPAFCVLTTSGVFTTLGQYMHAALKDRQESRAYGPYSFSADNDLNYGTAANAMAVIQDFLRVPLNFAALAQERLRDQVRLIESTAFAPVYLNRFLRQQGWSDWAAALCLGMGRHRKTDEAIDFHAAGSNLARYGFVSNAGGVACFTKTEQDLSDFQAGYVAGLRDVCNDMQDLSRGRADSAGANDALQRYQSERGFHPDALLLPESDLKKLAFQDLSDVLIAGLTSHLMLDTWLESSPDDKDDAAMLLFKEASQLWIDSGDVTSFMRLREHLYGLGLRMDGSAEPVAAFNDLQNRIQRAGYYVSDAMAMRRFNGLGFKLVVDAAGNFILQTDKMAQYKTIPHIIADNNLSDAIHAYEVLTTVIYPEALRAKQDEQKRLLSDFIEQKILERELRKVIADVPPEDRGAFIGFMRETFPHIVQTWVQEALKQGILKSEEVAQVNATTSRAFSQATQNTKPLFARVVRALERVGNLWKDPAPK